MNEYFLGVDVGTGSVRAGIFDAAGSMAGSARREIALHRASGGVAEQSAEEIWSAVAYACRGALENAELAPQAIRGIGFDATCSLVVVGENGASLPVGAGDRPERNVIVWMDHRAVAQAERINAARHGVLDYVGGRISPEMETPKLLWLKENRPAVFDAAWQFFDLTDYLTWRATGSLARSTCTVTCKWTYLAHQVGWDSGYFQDIGLGDLARDGFARIGSRVVEPGTPLADGLSARGAQALGLVEGTPVGAGLIDAHAGGIGTVGARDGGAPEDNLAYVFGTSSCTMTTTREPVFVPGVWGPYFSAMVPGRWLNEGGQSVAGAAISHLLGMHPAASQARAKADAEGVSMTAWLRKLAFDRVNAVSELARLAGGLCVVPDFLGNRAPHADPRMRAVIAGVGMEEDVDNLLAWYVAGICGIGYGLRQIIAAQSSAGARVKAIVISGGAGRNDLTRQLLADATGMPVHAPASPEPVLLGSAMLGATASAVYRDLSTAMEAMSSIAGRYEPAGGAWRDCHESGFSRFERFQALARELAADAG